MRGRNLGVGIWTLAMVGILIVAAVAFGQTTWPLPSQTRSVTQGGDWTISHIGSTVHVAGDLTATVNTVQHISSATHVTGIVRGHYSGAIRAWQVSACGTTAAMAIASNEGRRDLILSNLGGAAANSERNIIFIGFGTTGHVALSTSNGFPMAIHYAVFGGAATSNPTMVSTPPFVLKDYQGPVACVTNQNTAVLSILEILR